jgi:anti-sigma regulatory factor (Ser/Thr protein kinase)
MAGEASGRTPLADAEAGGDLMPLALEHMAWTCLSDPNLLGEVRRKLAQYASQAGMVETQADSFVLAADEALTNIIRHAYEGATDQPIDIDIYSDGTKLHLTLRDYGQPVPREMIRSRDLDDIRPGGLGVHIMTTCMDSVEFQHLEEGGTKLVMSKRIDTACLPAEGTV